MKTIYHVEDDINILENLLNKFQVQHRLLNRANRNKVTAHEVQLVKQIDMVQSELISARIEYIVQSCINSKIYEARTMLDL